MVFIGLDASSLDRELLKRGIARAMFISEDRVTILTWKQVVAGGEVRNRFLLSVEQERAVEVTFSVISESKEDAEIIQNELVQISDTTSSKSAWTNELQAAGLLVSDMSVVGDVTISGTDAYPRAQVGGQQQAVPTTTMAMAPPAAPPRAGRSRSIWDRKRELALYLLLPCALVVGIAVSLMCVLRARSSQRRDGSGEQEGGLANEALFYGDTLDLGSFNPMRGPAMTLAGGLNPLVDRDRHDSSWVELSSFFAPSSTTTTAPATNSNSSSSQDVLTRSSYVSNPLAPSRA